MFLPAAIWSCNPLSADIATDTTAEQYLFFTKGTGTPHVNSNRTYRVNEFYNGDSGELLADGAYCDYMNEERGWLYPCKVDDDGNALDADDAIIPYDAPDWFSRTVNDTKYALRMHLLNQEKYATIVVCSPARRMAAINPNAKPKVWAYKLDIDEEFYTSYPVADLEFMPGIIAGQYIYSDPIVLHDPRSRINVVIKCGTLDIANLHAVHFRNVMTSAWYKPKEMVYLEPVTDRGMTDSPFEAYTQNCYPESSGTTVPGNVLLVPEDKDDICLIKESGIAEWNSADNEGRCITAIQQFHIFSQEYGKIDPVTGKYVYESQIPEIVVYSGMGGHMKSTVRLAANMEPMKEYTVIISLSTASVTASLVPAAWNEIPEDIEFGHSLPVETRELSFEPWSLVDVDPSEGSISDPE